MRESKAGEKNSLSTFFYDSTMYSCLSWISEFNFMANHPTVVLLWIQMQKPWLRWSKSKEVHRVISKNTKKFCSNQVQAETFCRVVFETFVLSYDHKTYNDSSPWDHECHSLKKTKVSKKTTLHFMITTKWNTDKIWSTAGEHSGAFGS